MATSVAPRGRRPTRGLAVSVAAMLAALPAFAPLAPCNAGEPIRSVEIGRNREFRINGKPFLPIMLWAQSPSRINDGLSVGVNTFVGNGSSVSDKEFLDALGKNGLYGVMGFKQDTVGHRYLLGWIHSDEPDMPRGEGQTGPRQSPEELGAVFDKIKAADRSRPVFVTFTSGFMRKTSTRENAAAEALYPAYVKASDVAGFDYYPIFGENYPSRLDRVAEGVSELAELAGARPVYVWIEANTGSRWVTPSLQVPLKPMHVRAEVWMSVIRGATAIGYFTHRWKPDYRQFAPEREMAAELKRINEQLTRLAPAILADPARVAVAISMTDGLPCHVKATEHEGWLYVFAQNMHVDDNKESLRQGQDINPRGGGATITVEGLKAGTIVEVVDEGRAITASDGAFADDFGPLAEHVYRIAADQAAGH